MITRIMIFFLLLAILARCTDPVESGGSVEFGIFLLQDDKLNTNDVKHIPLSDPILNENPLIDIDDVKLYHWSNHSIELTDEGNKKFESVEKMVKSTYGLPFVVMAGGEKVYLGTIYPYYSSYIHPDLPSIGVSPFISLTIERAWDKSFVDVRNDERIYKALLRRARVE